MSKDTVQVQITFNPDDLPDLGENYYSAKIAEVFRIAGVPATVAFIATGPSLKSFQIFTCEPEPVENPKVSRVRQVQ